MMTAKEGTLEGMVTGENVYLEHMMNDNFK